MDYQAPKFTDKELLEMFPEAKKIIPRKIKECKVTIKEKKHEIAAALRKVYGLKADPFSEWFGEQLIKMLMMPGLVKMEQSLLKLNNFKYLLNPNRKNNATREFGEKIEEAKKYPIEKLAEGRMDLRQVGKNFIGLCPFHNEKRPSFYIYPSTNSYHCYGCGSHGDQISLLMAFEGVSFVDAVNMLRN